MYLSNPLTCSSGRRFSTERSTDSGENALASIPVSIGDCQEETEGADMEDTVDGSASGDDVDEVVRRG